MERFGKAVIVVACLCFLFVLAQTLIASARAHTVDSVTGEFRRDLVILAPHIASADSLSLYAEWAKMKNEADYRSIRKRIDALLTSLPK